MGVLVPEKVLEALVQGLEAAKQKALKDHEDITQDLEDAFDCVEGDELTKDVTFVIKLKIDRGKGLIDVKGLDRWSVTRGGSFDAGNVMMGECLEGAEDWGKNPGQGQGRDMHDGSTPEEQIAKTKTKPKPRTEPEPGATDPNQRAFDATTPKPQ